MDKDLEFKFLSDNPAGKDDPGYFDFYHKNIVPALKNIIENETCVHTIGLFGKWGTGKSTIIKILKSEMNVPVFIFDTWKYQDDALRRIFLIELVEFLENEKFSIDKSILDNLYKSTSIEKNKTIESGIAKNFLSNIRENWLVIVSFFFIVVWVVVKKYYPNKIIGTISDFVAILSAIPIFFQLFLPVFKEVLQDFLHKIIQSISPSIELYKVIEREERLNSPEQFEKVFKDIIEKIDRQIIIVFDNIDRVSGESAIKTLATIKTFLDPLLRPEIIFIIPCDKDAIEKQIKKVYGEKDGSSLESTEYLRKIFNLTVWTPDFIEEDLELYTKTLIDQIGPIGEIFDKKDVIFVINSAFQNNPREIKQFINNLISAVLIASKTNVWEVIKTKISYLSKVLILKQCYSEAYKLLKERWFDPENILPNDASREIRDFMLKTNLISVENAEPFLYFKKSVTSDLLANSEKIKLSLLSKENEQAKKLILAEKNKEAVINYICDLLRKYQNQESTILPLFKNQLSVLSEMKFALPEKYYDISLTVFEAHLWNMYRDISTDLVFSVLLNNQNTTHKLREKIFDRYISSLGDEQNSRLEKREFLINTLNNFIKYRQLLSKKQKYDTAINIQQRFISLDIINLYETIETQQDFVTVDCLKGLMSGITNDNFINYQTTLITYQSFIKNNNLINEMIAQINLLLSNDCNANPVFSESREIKEKLIDFVTNILDIFKKDLTNIQVETISDLSSKLLQELYTIKDPSDQTIMLKSLIIISEYLTAEQRTEVDATISRIFADIPTDKIKTVFESFNITETTNTITISFDKILPRLSEEGASDLLDYIYNKVDNDRKTKIILHLIDKMANSGIDFISKNIEELSSKEEITKALVLKSITLEIRDRISIYNLISKLFRKRDSDEIANSIAEQLMDILKRDDNESLEIGFNFLENIKVNLKAIKKTEIAKACLDFLREPGRIITIEHNFVLKGISSLFTFLQRTSQDDYLTILFDNLSAEKDLDVINMILSELNARKPKYSIHRKSFELLLEKLKEWPDNDAKHAIASVIIGMKPATLSRYSESYWNNLLTISENKIEGSGG